MHLIDGVLNLYFSMLFEHGLSWLADKAPFRSTTPDTFQCIRDHKLQDLIGRRNKELRAKVVQNIHYGENWHTKIIKFLILFT